MLVLFTTIVFGAMMPMLIKFFKTLDKKAITQVSEGHEYIELDNLNEMQFGYMHPNFTSE